MGYPDFYHGKQLYQTFKSLTHSSTTPGAGNYVIFEYTGAGEVVFGHLTIVNAAVSVTLSDDILCKLDGVYIQVTSLFELRRDIQIDGTAIFYCSNYTPARGMDINISRGIMFNNSLRIELEQNDVTPVAMNGDLTIGAY